MSGYDETSHAVRVGERARAIRKARGLSQEELAALLPHKSHNAARVKVARFERGRGVSVDALYEMAAALGVLVDFLLGSGWSDVRTLEQLRAIAAASTKFGDA